MNELSPPETARESSQRYVDIRWDVSIPMRDGVYLSAILYLPPQRPAPAIFTLTPYVAQRFHDKGMYFASHGYVFLAIDVRGRGNSEGDFRPLIQEASDAYDVIEWLALQPYCSGQVAMRGASYGAYAQWAAAKEFPPHLSTIVPMASPYVGIDFPMRKNVFQPYLMQWLTLVYGCALQDKVFWNNEAFWANVFRRWHESGTQFKTLDSQMGNPSAIFQEWLEHPQLGEYWDHYNPTTTQYSRLSIPVLTITGVYDGDQLGALMHYRQHLANNPNACHYLVIGPWDHAGTSSPQQAFCGLKIGPAGLLDILRLHLDWYAWVMRGGPAPEFLQKKVAYYVMGSEKWRYADSLDSVTESSAPFYLSSTDNPTDVFHSGSLVLEPQAVSVADQYIYDPRNLDLAELESSVDPENRVDQRLTYAAVGKQLVYHSAPFERDAEISGFFSLTAWLSIDTPDTDFRATVYEVALDGEVVQMSADWIRARYRQSLHAQELIATAEPLPYHFDRFTFVSRRVCRGHRLRLVVGPINSIYSQRNHNSGAPIADESMSGARSVTVRLFHDTEHPSALIVPFGRREV